MRVLFVSLLAFLLIAPAYAADQVPSEASVAKLRRIKAQAQQGATEGVKIEQKEVSEETPSLAGKAFQGLFLCLGLFLVMVYFLKKGSPGGNASEEKRLHLQERLNIGPKAAVALLQVDGKEILVGVSESNISFLREVSSKQQTSKPIALESSQVVQCINE